MKWIIVMLLLIPTATAMVDLSVEIPASFQTVEPGSDVLASISIRNADAIGRVDVQLEYSILHDGIVYEKSETIAVETQANIVRIFTMDELAEEGKYDLLVSVIYADGSSAESSHSFMVQKSASPSYVIPIAVGLASVLLLSLFLLYAKKRETMHIKHQVKKIVKDRLR